MSPDRPAAAPDVRTDSRAPTTNADWTVQIADTVDSVVRSVRDKTSIPLETVARGVVYGILIAVMGLAALILLTILVVRALTYLPGAEVWMVYTGLGTIFTIFGLFLWRKRRPPTT